MAVQKLLKARAEKHVAHKSKTTPLGAMVVCGHCGAYFRRKCTSGQYAINSTMAPKRDLIQSITTAMTEEVIRLPNSGMTIGEIQQRLEDLSAEFAAVLALTKENGTESYMDRFREIAEETAEQYRGAGKAGYGPFGVGNCPASYTSVG